MIELKGLFDGKEIKLTLTEEILNTLIQEEIKPIEESLELTGYERVRNTNFYYHIDNEGVDEIEEDNDYIDDRYYNVANYFSTQERAEEEDKIQTLRRKLKRFSYENGGNEIDWQNPNQNKYSLEYNAIEKEWNIETNQYLCAFERVYFISKEVAEKAIETFKDELDEIKKYFI